MGRTADAERILRRVTAQVEERLLGGERVQPQQLLALSIAAAKMSLDLGDATWGSWVAQIHRRMSTVPAAPVVDSLAGLVARFPEQENRRGAPRGPRDPPLAGASEISPEEDARSLTRPRATSRQCR